MSLCSKFKPMHIVLADQAFSVLLLFTDSYLQKNWLILKSSAKSSLLLFLVNALQSLTLNFDIILTALNNYNTLHYNFRTGNIDLAGTYASILVEN
jgi:hypothetical protein